MIGVGSWTLKGKRIAGRPLSYSMAEISLVASKKQYSRNRLVEPRGLSTGTRYTGAWGVPADESWMANSPLTSFLVFRTMTSTGTHVLSRYAVKKFVEISMAMSCTGGSWARAGTPVLAARTRIASSNSTFLTPMLSCCTPTIRGPGSRSRRQPAIARTHGLR